MAEVRYANGALRYGYKVNIFTVSNSNYLHVPGIMLVGASHVTYQFEGEQVAHVFYLVYSSFDTRGEPGQQLVEFV